MNPNAGAQPAAAQELAAKNNRSTLDAMNGRGAWDIASSEPDRELGEMLLIFADLASETPACSEASLLHEALVVIAPWGRSAGSEAWHAREARIRRMIEFGACESAAIALLPLGAALSCCTLADAPATAEVVLPEGTRSGPTSGQTLAIAMIAALFRALAVRDTSG